MYNTRILFKYFYQRFIYFHTHFFISLFVYINEILVRRNIRGTFAEHSLKATVGRPRARVDVTVYSAKRMIECEMSASTFIKGRAKERLHPIIFSL